MSTVSTGYTMSTVSTGYILSTVSTGYIMSTVSTGYIVSTVSTGYILSTVQCLQDSLLVNSTLDFIKNGAALDACFLSCVLHLELPPQLSQGRGTARVLKASGLRC